MNNENELGKRAVQFAECLLNDNESYHNHKETMAHACVVLEIVIFGWIMSKDGWSIATSMNPIIFWFTIIAIWILLHVYIRWELRFRRWAAKQDAGIRRMLCEWTRTNPKKDKFEAYQDKPKKPHWLQSLIDCFIPHFCGSHPHDLAAKGYPIPLVEAIEEASKEKDNSLRLGEWLPTGLSLILIIIIILRKLTDC